MIHRRRHPIRRAMICSCPLPVFTVFLLVVHVLVRCTQGIDPFRAIHVLNQGSSKEAVLTPSLRSKHTIEDATYQNVQELYLEQPLDHFFSSTQNGNGTLKQRYFYSDRYATKYDNSIGTFAFLCVGGEGPSLSKSVLVDSVHCTGDMLELAMKLHEEQNAVVHLFALEHRYYGESYPVFCNGENDVSCSPVTNDHLVYPTSRHALYDLSRFVEIQTAELNLGKDTKWVPFGGSYPGMLAAWARLLFPEKVHAAVSNSAPIQATLDFRGYNDWVGLDTRYQAVGGSNECFEILVEGHAEILQALGKGQHEQITQMFGVCNATSLLEKPNIDMFVGDGVIEIPAQGNDPNCLVGLCNIDQLCLALVTESRALSTSMQVLATVARIQRYDESSCLTVDWNATLEYLASPHSKEIRSWLWQTCAEFGFYQTCEVDSDWCPYGRGHHTLDMDLSICQVAFGVNAEMVKQNVQDSLDYYGGWKLNATRILSVNGDVDPWSILALKESSSLELPTHWVKGASHHFWTHSVQDSDDDAIVEARNVIYQQVTEWLLDETEDDVVTEEG